MLRFARNFRRAFTLVEMLVVISIIIVMISIAVPVVKTLTGNSSLAGAENKVAAMLAVARSDAIYNRQITGVLFFVDPQTNDFAMAEVMPNQMYSSDPRTSGTPAALVPQTVPYTGGVPSLELVYTWQPQTGTATVAMTKYYYRDIVPLPPGVGVALCNNIYTNLSITPAINNQFPNEFQDRYMHFGAIMFNTDGTLLQMPYGIAGIYSQPYNPASPPPLPRADTAQALPPFPNSNQLTARLITPGLNGLVADLTTVPSVNPIPTTTINLPLTSATGLIFYDRAAFLSQHDTTTTDAFIDSDANANGNNTHADLEIWPLLPGYTNATATTPSNNQQIDKFDEESWLDQNGTTAMVSPLNGNLVKSK